MSLLRWLRFDPCRGVGASNPPASFIMTAIMFFYLIGLSVRDSGFDRYFATIKWGCVGSRECAASTFIVGQGGAIGILTAKPLASR